MLNLFRIGLALRFQLFQTCPVLLRLLLFLNDLPVLRSDVRPGLRQTLFHGVLRLRLLGEALGELFPILL